MVSDCFPYTRGALDVRLLIKLICTFQVEVSHVSRAGNAQQRLIRVTSAATPANLLAANILLLGFHYRTFMNYAGQKTNEPHLLMH